MIPCPSGNGYDFICTHVDDFKIVADNPYHYLTLISSALFVKSHGPREYYLGNDYTHHPQHHVWTYNCKTYEEEAVLKAEMLLECLVKKKDTPASE